MSPRNRVPLTVEHILLGLIQGRLTHGYEVYRSLSGHSELGTIWRVKRSQLYALLDRLEAEGYIVSTPEPGEGRPPRKMLALTSHGKLALQAWASSPVIHGREMRLDFLAKLYFAQQTGSEQALALVARQRAACEQWLADLRARIDRLPETGGYERLVCQFRAEQIAAMLRWLADYEQTVSTRRVRE